MEVLAQLDFCLLEMELPRADEVNNSNLVP